MTYAVENGTTATSVPCADCGSSVTPGMLACPGCHRLVHGDALVTLKTEAEAAAAAGDYFAELSAWRSAAALLPPNSRQYAAVASKIDILTKTGAPAGGPDVDLPSSGPWKWLAGLGAAGLFLFKFKFLIVALLTKGKFLVLGLTKASTFMSMLLAFGVYWTAWGMWFAAGLVLSIYVHEMGHVAALRRYGLAASAPMFVPGLGAFIRLGAGRLAPHEDARIGLAGPTWGLGAAAVALAAGHLGAGPMYLAVAHTGAWLNLFNLLPVWQLDGNRGFAALSRLQRWMVAALFLCAWGAAGDGLLVLLALVAAVRAAQGDAPHNPDRGVMILFGGLIAALTMIFMAAA